MQYDRCMDEKQARAYCQQLLESLKDVGLQARRGRNHPHLVERMRMPDSSALAQVHAAAQGAQDPTVLENLCKDLSGQYRLVQRQMHELHRDLEGEHYSQQRRAMHDVAMMRGPFTPPGRSSDALRAADKAQRMAREASRSADEAANLVGAIQRMERPEVSPIVDEPEAHTHRADWETPGSAQLDL